MADKPFRILLDLTDLYIESFKYVWINVSPRELKTIADFKLSLCRKINFGRKDFNLFVRDGLLLDEETILVLREDDTIKVQYESSHQASGVRLNEHKERKKSSSKRSHSDCANEVSPVPNKRQKTKNNFINKDATEIQFEDMVDKGKKSKKSSNSLSLGNDNEMVIQNSDVVRRKKKNMKNISLENNTSFNNEVNSDAFISFPVEDELLRENGVEEFETIKTIELPSSSSSESCNNLNSPKITIRKDTFNEESKSQLNDSTTFEKSTNNCPKKKRKRHKKRKSVNTSAVEEVHDIVNYCTEFVLVKNSELNNNKRKHILYNSPPHISTAHEIPEITLDSNSDKTEINVSNETYNVPDVLTKVEADMQNEYPKISTPSQSKSCIDPNWHVSLVQDEKSIPYSDENKCFKVTKIDKSDSQISTPDAFSDQNFKDFKNKKDPPYAKFPTLNAMPEIGTHIAYKILELNENYSPEVSKYKEGIVRAINKVTDEIEIELKRYEVKPRRTGKFEFLVENEVLLPEVKKHDIVTWTMLIEPKLLSKA